MKNTVLLALLLMLYCSSIFCQFKISGKVIDETKEPIEFVNIILYNQRDSIYIEGTITNHLGNFIFSDVPQGNYSIKISLIGYEDKFMQLAIDDADIELGDITFLKSPFLLNDIVVESKNPFFKMDNNSLIANISTTSLNSVGTANDVLLRIPTVTIIDGKLTVFGKGTPLVYVNNRHIKDLSELDRILSSEISTVELVTNPDARYDAQGKAVLIVRTKKKQSGWAMNVSERLTQGTHLGDAENVNISYGTNNLNIFASYYHGHQKAKTNEENFYNVYDEKKWNHNIYSPYYHSYIINQVSSGIDWSINDKHTLGIQYQLNTQRANSITRTNGISILNDKLYDEFTSNSLVKEKPYRHLLNGFYNVIFSDNLSLHIDIDYIKNHTERNQNTLEFSEIENRQVKTYSESDFHLYAGKMIMDYKSVIGSFLFGGEYNTITGDGFLTKGGESENNNIFENKERKSALFIDYSKEINTTKLDIGLRYEYSREKNIEGKHKNMASNRKYHNIYPDLSLSQKFGDFSLSLQLNRKVQRPAFEEINDNVYYINRFVLQKGNSTLKEVDIYNLNLQAMFKKFYLNFGYKYEKDPIGLYNEYDNNTSSIYIYTKNYPKYQEINSLLNYKDKIRLFEINYSIGIVQPFFSSIYKNEKHSYNNPSVSFQAFNDIILPKQFILSLNYTYQGKNIYYTIENSKYNRVDIGIRKSLFNNTLRLNLEARDIFNGVKEKNKFNIENTSFYQIKKRETRFVIFSMNYLFNNYKKKYRGNEASGEDINRM